MTITTPRTTRTVLVQHSLQVLEQGQAPSGSLVAAPSYPTYNYAWLRDGSFCADALDRYARHEPAGRFHAWVCRTVLLLRSRVELSIDAAVGGLAAAMLPTRFELDGTEESGEENWPNFQLDGYGTWLWAFGQHLARASRPMTAGEAEAVRLVARYLQAAGDQPCYDCWEEHVEQRHAATIAACAAGLHSAASLLQDNTFHAAAAELSTVLERDFVRDGSFVKHDGTDGVDGSLLWLALPFNTIPAADPRFVRTVERVEAELLVPGGGVRRYQGDTFYGGGEWIILTAWLGWALHALGRRDDAIRCLDWIESVATPGADLPEQLTTRPQSPPHVAEWLERWGDVATPLLWSHAMYLCLIDEMGLR